MNTNLNFETPPLEVKKIKAKQLTTTLVIVAFLSVTLASSAYAIDSNTQELTLDGSGVDSKIFLSISGSSNMVALDTADGRSHHVESKVKFYNSGGFSLKNPESGILVFGHPISDVQYKILILTSDGPYRLLANVIDLNYSEPKSSLGADITRHDIPTVGRIDHTPTIHEEVFDPDTLDIISNVAHNVQYKHEIVFDFTVIDSSIASEKDQRVGNAQTSITLTNPLGVIIEEWSGLTDNFGSFNESWFVVDNEVLGEYTLDVLSSFESFTDTTATVSFFVIPIDEGSSSRCPSYTIWNGTGGLCEIA